MLLRCKSAAVIAVIITELGKLKVLLWPDTRDEEDKVKAKGGRYTWRPVSKSRLGRLGRWIRLKLAGVDEFEVTTVDPKGDKDKENGGCCHCTWTCPKLNCNETLKEKMDSCEGCSSCVPCSHTEPHLISPEDAKDALRNMCSNTVFHCCGAGGQSKSISRSYQTDPCCPCKSRSAAAGGGCKSYNTHLCGSRVRAWGPPSFHTFMTLLFCCFRFGHDDVEIMNVCRRWSTLSVIVLCHAVCCSWQAF